MYFQQLFDSVPLDRDGIQEARRSFDYPAVASRFRMIDDSTVSAVIKCYGHDAERRQVRGWLEDLRARRSNPRQLFRRLQPYTVAIRAQVAGRYTAQGFFEPLTTDGALGEWHGRYDEIRGLAAENPEAGALIS